MSPPPPGEELEKHGGDKKVALVAKGEATIPVQTGEKTTNRRQLQIGRRGV